MGEQVQVASRWATSTEPFEPDEIQILETAEQNPRAIISSSSLRSKLGFWSTCGIIINRMIGTGIYSTPGTILLATDSIGASLILWAVGFLVSLAGLFVYMEFGLSIPQYRDVRGVRKSIPRSGGEKNYLEYIYDIPRYLTTCVYGVVFLVFGNTAGNAIAFSEYILRARRYTESDIDNPDHKLEWLIRGLSIGVITLACLLHGSWRSGGIFLNNLFATIKVCTLLVFIICGFAFCAGLRSKNPKVTAPDNLDLSTSFESSLSGATGKLYGYSQSLMLVIFAFGGFDNANYVMSEIKNPKVVYKWACLFSMGLVSVLYMLTNIVYFLVIDKEEFKTLNTQLAVTFFEKILGPGERIQDTVTAFVALSSLGNIVVVTFVASKVKQEIAKEGVLPWSRLIASDTQTPFSWVRNKLRKTAGSGEVEENTPIPALTLHWLFSIVLVISPKIQDSYTILLLMHSYTLQVWVGFLLGAGLVYLYWKPKSTWKAESGFKPIGSWFWAAFFALVNLFLIFAPFITPPNTNTFRHLIFKETKYWVYPTVTLSIMAFGVVYWFAFAKIYPHIIKKELEVTRVPIVHDGVQIYEAVTFNWIPPSEGDGSIE